jgi:hypothetical protein
LQGFESPTGYEPYRRTLARAQIPRNICIVAEWLTTVFVLGLLLLFAAGLFECHRYSRGRGIWWKLRLWKRDCSCVYPSDWDELPPDSGVREPRSPRPSGPSTSAAL